MYVAENCLMLVPLNSQFKGAIINLIDITGLESFYNGGIKYEILKIIPFVCYY